MKKLLKSILALLMAIVLIIPAGNVSADESQVDPLDHAFLIEKIDDTIRITCNCDDEECLFFRQSEEYKLDTPNKYYDKTFYNLVKFTGETEFSDILFNAAIKSYSCEYKLLTDDNYSEGNFNTADAGSYCVRVTLESDYTDGSFIFEKSFEIYKRNVTVVAGSETKVYDGNPLTCNTFTIKEDDSEGYGFAKEEGVESVVMTAESSITNPGTVKNVINPAHIKTKPGTDPNNYDVTYEDGILEVTKLTCNKVPEGLVAVQPSHYGLSDGAVSGTAIDMEYSRDAGFSTATDCEAGQTTGLAAGTYYVRIKENDTTKASNYITIVIPNGDGYTPSQGSGNEGNGGSQSSSSEGNSGSQSTTGEGTEGNNGSQSTDSESSDANSEVTDVNNDTQSATGEAGENVESTTNNESDLATTIAALELPAEVEQTISEMAKTEEGAESVKLLEQILTANKSEGDAQNSDNQNADSSARLTVEVSETSPDKADKGSLKNNVFKTPEGEIIKNSFVESTKSGKKYFADENGKRVTDAIVTDGEKLYYCNKSGVVQVNKAVTLANNATVLTDKTGAIITKSDAKLSVGGKSYITGEGGVVVQDSKVTISVSTKKNGKTETVERTYITNEKGVVMTGLVSYNGKSYVTSKTGIVRKNKITKINGKKVYTNKNGVVVVNKTVKIDGVKYKADKNGYLKKIK